MFRSIAPLYVQRTPDSRPIRESVLKTGTGPLWIQDHDSPVKFRNVWICPLGADSFEVSPKENEGFTGRNTGRGN